MVRLDGRDDPDLGRRFSHVQDPCPGSCSRWCGAQLHRQRVGWSDARRRVAAELHAGAAQPDGHQRRMTKRAFPRYRHMGGTRPARVVIGGESVLAVPGFPHGWEANSLRLWPRLRWWGFFPISAIAFRRFSRWDPAAPRRHRSPSRACYDAGMQQRRTAVGAIIVGVCTAGGVLLGRVLGVGWDGAVAVILLACVVAWACWPWWQKRK